MPIIGHYVSLKGSSPKTHGEGRICAKPGCETVLSQYNKEEYCYADIPDESRIIPRNDNEVLRPTKKERQLLKTPPSM